MPVDACLVLDSEHGIDWFLPGTLRCSQTNSRKINDWIGSFHVTIYSFITPYKILDKIDNGRTTLLMWWRKLQLF